MLKRVSTPLRAQSCIYANACSIVYLRQCVLNRVSTPLRAQSCIYATACSIVYLRHCVLNRVSTSMRAQSCIYATACSIVYLRQWVLNRVSTPMRAQSRSKLFKRQIIRFLRSYASVLFNQFIYLFFAETVILSDSLIDSCTYVGNRSHDALRPPSSDEKHDVPGNEYSFMQRP